MPVTALIGLGSNLGDRPARLSTALARLASTPGVRLRSFSPFQSTAPAGGPPGQGAFLNAAALVRTDLAPGDLLRELLRIEAEAGRVREVRWGSRSLDLDLLLYGREQIETPDLTVPHPRLAVRRFVLAPAAEVAPRVVAPGTGRTIAELLANLDRRPSRLAVLAPPGRPAAALVDRLTVALDAERLPDLAPGPGSPEPEPPDAGRWQIQQGWFDQSLVEALLTFGSNPCRLLPFRDAFLRARGRTAPPTFVAFWDPPPPAGLGWPDRLRDAYRAYLTHALRRAPVLHVEAPDLDGAASEILAACTASRP